MGRLTMVIRYFKRFFELKNILLINFIILLFNLFMIVMQLNQGVWPVETFFQTIMSQSDKDLMMDTFKTFINAIESANLSYIAYSGTLIGAYRHHGFIPWDDDVDVMLNFSEKAKVRTVLKGLEPKYSLYIYGDDNLEDTWQWKFYKNEADGFIHKSFKWPYIDIFFFRENATHMWDASYTNNDDYYFEKSRTYPLVDRPFENIKIKAPCDTGYFLRKSYRIDLCRSRQYNHMAEIPMFTFNTKDVPCERLYHIAPFVFRTFSNKTINETLKIADYKLDNYVVNSCSSGT